jgi:hypothetical protein
MRRALWTKQRNEKIAEMRKLLEEHDWHYDKSDDSRVYDRGLAERRKIEALAKTDGNLMKIYNAKKKKVYV